MTQDLSDPLHQRHAHCKEKSSRDCKAKAEPSWKICNEGTQKRPTHIGYVNRAKSNNEDPPALPIWLRTKGVEALQHGECKASMNSASDDNPTFRQRLSIHKREEKAQWKDTLHIGRSIMYAMVATRPDLAHVIEVVYRYMSNPRRKHWEAA